MLADVPITKAIVLVALATFDDVPKKSSAGKVMMVPPPATALMAPPAAAASIKPMISVSGISPERKHPVIQLKQNGGLVSPSVVLPQWNEDWRGARLPRAEKHHRRLQNKPWPPVRWQKPSSHADLRRNGMSEWQRDHLDRVRSAENEAANPEPRTRR